MYGECLIEVCNKGGGGGGTGGVLVYGYSSIFLCHFFSSAVFEENVEILS